MREPAVIQKFGSRLVRLGFAGPELERRIREMGDHYEDLRQAAVDQGLSEAKAEERAARQLGSPEALADQLAGVTRRSCWYGRHRLLAFCLLPPLAQALLMVLLVLVVVLVDGCFSKSLVKTIVRQPSGQLLIEAGVALLFCTAAAVTSCLFCWMARRSVAGLKWALAACLVCAVNNWFFQAEVGPHSVAVGYYIPRGSGGLSPLVPLMAAAFVWLRHRRREREYDPGSATGKSSLWPRAIGLLVGCASAGLFAGCAGPQPTHQRGWIGGDYKAVRTPDSLKTSRTNGAIANSLGRCQDTGILVTALSAKAPARLAGVHEGDLILEVNHQPVTRLRDFRQAIDQSGTGAFLPVRAYRDGELIECQVPVGRETFRSEASIALALPLFVDAFWLSRTQGISLIVLGWKTNPGVRKELASAEETYLRSTNPEGWQVQDEDWRAWLAVLQVSRGKLILSQESAPSP